LTIESLRCRVPGGAAASRIQRKEATTVTRYGQVIRIKPDRLEEYKRHHASVWPEILAMIRACHVTNYSIFHKDGLLFAYFEYVGDDLDADMKKMAADPRTQEWWNLVKPMQRPLETRAEGEWWASMDEVFHTD
jgi:L-rhamnose mutarotase